MSMNTKKNISIVLLVLALLLWLLRKMNVLYIPGLSMVLLGLSMIMVGIMMFQVKQKKKLGGTLILAFGLFCIVTAEMRSRAILRERHKEEHPFGCSSFAQPPVPPQQPPQFPFSVKFSRFPFPITEKICKISIKRLDKR